MTTIEQPDMSRTDCGLRYQCEDILKRAFRKAFLYTCGWGTAEEFSAHVIRPVLFPEHFLETEPSEVIQFADRQFKIETIDDYRSDLRWGMLLLCQSGELTEDMKYETETLLGWVATMPEATVKPFPVERTRSPQTSPEDQDAEIIPLFA